MEILMSAVIGLLMILCTGMCIYYSVKFGKDLIRVWQERKAFSQVVREDGVVGKVYVVLFVALRVLYIVGTIILVVSLIINFFKWVTK